MKNCKSCGHKNSPNTKDLRELSPGFYIVSKVYKTAMNPNGVILGPFLDYETGLKEYRKFTFLRKLINPKLISLGN